MEENGNFDVVMYVGGIGIFVVVLSWGIFDEFWWEYGCWRYFYVYNEICIVMVRVEVEVWIYDVGGVIFLVSILGLLMFLDFVLLENGCFWDSVGV